MSTIYNIKYQLTYKIIDLKELSESIDNFYETYWYLIDSHGQPTSGNTYLIAITDVKEKDKSMFEKYSRKVAAIEFTGDLYGFNEFLNERGIADRYEYWINEEEEFGLIVEVNHHSGIVDYLIEYDEVK